jgi:hypothetical protein
LTPIAGERDWHRADELAVPLREGGALSRLRRGLGFKIATAEKISVLTDCRELRAPGLSNAGEIMPAGQEFRTDVSGARQVKKISNRL